MTLLPLVVIDNLDIEGIATERKEAREKRREKKRKMAPCAPPSQPFPPCEREAEERGKRTGTSVHLGYFPVLRYGERR